MFLPLSRPSSSERTIPLSESLIAALKAHRARTSAERLKAGRRWRDHDLVFPSTKGTPIDPSTLREHFKSLLEPSGLPETTRFHDLRHTHVAWLIAGGAPLPHIQARLGHESITTTIDTYGHLLPAGDELITRIIDIALTGGTVRPMSTP
mgnify:CR=1 FL=1